MRLFIAIKFKDQVIDKINKIKHDLMSQDIEGKFVEADLFHITLHYIGPSSMEEYHALRKMIHTIDDKPFMLETGSLNFFGKHRKKKLLYLSLKKSSALYQLHEQIIKKLRIIGYEIESYDYVPHITLARNAVFDFSAIKTFFEPISIEVSEVHLVESKRVNNQLVYETKDYVKI